MVVRIDFGVRYIPSKLRISSIRRKLERTVSILSESGKTKMAHQYVKLMMFKICCCDLHTNRCADSVKSLEFNRGYAKDQSGKQNYGHTVVIPCIK